MDSCVTPRDISHRSILRGPRGHSRHQLLRGDHGLLHKSRRAATRVCARRGGKDHVVRRSPDQHQQPRSDFGLWLFAGTGRNDYLIRPTTSALRETRREPSPCNPDRHQRRRSDHGLVPATIGRYFYLGLGAYSVSVCAKCARPGTVARCVRKAA